LNVDSGVTLYDASVGGRLVMRGEDHRNFLHNFCTHDIEGLADGESCEAFVTDMRGHVLGHLWVVAQPECLWLHSLGESVESLVGHLQKYVITEDVVIEDVTERTSRVVLCGEGSAAAAERISESLSESWGAALSQAPVAWLSQGDVLLWLESEDGSDLPLAAMATGVPVGTPESFESRRIAALLPRFGLDIDSSHLAQEVDRDELAISFSKGCYLGQETIARVESRGRVNRLLRGLGFEGEAYPEPGAVIVSEGGGEEANEVGRVGSVAVSEGRLARSADTAVALAMVRREVSEAGTRVQVQTSEGLLSAWIVERVV
jgi:folate-binding protein YgfZ